MGKTIHVYDTGELTFALFQETLLFLLANRELTKLISLEPISGKDIRKGKLSHINTIGLMLPKRSNIQDYYDELGEEGMEAIQRATRDLGLSNFAVDDAAKILSSGNAYQLSNEKELHAINPYGIFEGSVAHAINESAAASGLNLTEVTFIPPTQEGEKIQGHVRYQTCSDYILKSKDQKMNVLAVHTKAHRFPGMLSYKPPAAIEFKYGEGTTIFSQIHPLENKPEQEKDINTMILNCFLDNCLNSSRGKVLPIKKPVASMVANF